MGRGLLGLLVVAIGVLVALAVGNPYFSWAIARVVGEQTAWSQNVDGTRSTRVSGPGVAFPDWIPVMPGALEIKAGRWIEYEGRPSKSGDLELLSHDEASAIVAWYEKELAARGFTVAAQRPKDEAEFSRRMSAVEGEVRADNPSLGVTARVVVRARQGILLRPRLIEVNWFDRPGARS